MRKNAVDWCNKWQTCIPLPAHRLVMFIFLKIPEYRNLYIEFSLQYLVVDKRLLVFDLVMNASSEERESYALFDYLYTLVQRRGNTSFLDLKPMQRNM